MPEAKPETPAVGPKRFEPRIVAFFCNWCTYLAADLAGTSRMKYAPNMRVIRTMCSGRVDPQFVLDAFARGADGVLDQGCRCRHHPVRRAGGADHDVDVFRGQVGGAQGHACC